MPSSDIIEDEPAPTVPKKATKPRRSPAVRRSANATPSRNATANKADTPNSAPARTKSGSKKAEPTLLTDFLLGRPSVSRTRRKSLDVVPMEMRRSAVGKVQPPGGVKERVKQWQKASAAAVVKDTSDPPSEPDDISWHLDDASVTEQDRHRIKFRKNHTHRPGRRKSGDKDNPKRAVKDMSSPRRRVVSDDHWVVKKEEKSPPRMPKVAEEVLSKGQTLSKDFLKNSANPPLEKKIQDWNKRTIDGDGGPQDRQARKASQSVPKNAEHRPIQSKPESPDRAVPARPPKEKPGTDDSVEKTAYNQERRKERQSDTEGFNSPRRGSEKKRNPNNDEEESDVSCRTPTRSPRSKNRKRKSASPESLADIPVGYSAFSVLDVSMGGEATTTRPPKPLRQPSLSAVPKVLRKVYTEGMKKVHDAVEPPRIGVNQPPSIESWLNGTSDPFLDDASTSESIFGIAKAKPRRWSREKEISHPKVNCHENEDCGIAVVEPPNSGILTSRDGVQAAVRSLQGGEISVAEKPPNERKVSQRTPQTISPTGLKRSPATRHVSPPKTIRHTPPRDVAADSCNGQRQSTPKEEFSSSFAKASDPKYDIKKGTESATRALKDHDHEIRGNIPQPTSIRSPQIVDAFYLNSKNIPGPGSHKSSSKEDRITTGQHRLSTIASVETFKTSSLTETSSELSETTVTETTVTQNTSRTSNTSNLSYASEKISNQRSNDLGLKRRLTKHSDLLSVLSLPDSTVPGKTKSIRSARSIRTARTHLDTATIKDLLRELADDEAKYMRELKTLVDGVVPVLLSCVLSKSDSAVAAGLFGQNLMGQTDALLTKPIVDMGIALEQLKTFHKRIPLHDSELLLHWASGAHKVYENYIDAWRMGFHNVIVNLAPASQSKSAGDRSLDEIARNEDGDVLNENGERVDVAFLLKRPLVRVKYLAKVMKGIHTIRPREQAAKVNDQYQDLVTKIRRRTREEEARLEDQAAYSTDATRARDPRTLEPLENVMIDTTRQVYAKDFFDFGLSHSSGQRIDCRVELLFRDKPQDKSDPGDILICQVDSISRWLLFPPVELNRISARAGDATGELVVMIRGTETSNTWHELFTLTSADNETTAEWIQMLGVLPRPPKLRSIDMPSVPTLPLLRAAESAEGTQMGLRSSKSNTTSSHDDTDVPIGERRGKYEHLRPSKSHYGEERDPIAKSSPLSPSYSNDVKTGDISSSGDKPSNFNVITEHAEKMASCDLKLAKSKRYHSDDTPQSSVTPPSKNLARNNDGKIQQQSKSTPSPGHHSDSSCHEDLDSTDTTLRSSKYLSAEMPPVPKHRKIPQTITNGDGDLPLKHSIIPNDPFQTSRAPLPTNQVLEKMCEAPLPPPHGTSSQIQLKSSPVLAKPTSIAKARRSSSPLKHEYQPSGTSDTSSASDESDFGDFGESSDSSEEELEAVDLTGPDVGRPRNKVSPPGSSYSLASTSLAPSNSASQAPYHGSSLELNVETTKLVATISCWSDKGRWVDLDSRDCSVVVGPGFIEAYAMSENLPAGSAGDHVSSSGSSSDVMDKDAAAIRPLVSLELTPIVPLRQSNALDIEIRSPPTAKSSVECTHTVRFRSHTLQECSTLYAAIHKARMENPVYMKLEQERIVNAYGKQLLEETAGSNRRRSWFGRSKSYRASARAPSVTVSDNSTNSIASAILRLRSIGFIGAFNIDKSSVGTSQGIPSGTSSGATSVYTGSTNSASSRTTPPRSPSSPSTAMTGTSNVISFGSKDLKIRLYLNVTPSKWSDFGSAFLTITHPPRGMRQASSLYHGVEKRIIVTKKQGTKRTLGEKLQGSGSPKSEEPGPLLVILDVVIGGACFSRQGVVGIVMNVWEDIRGDNGEVGKVAAMGGVSGRTRRWMFHFASAAETAWVFSLVGGGMR